jgi:hypothetical protein
VAENLKKGDKIRWDSHGGEAVGEVEEKITSGAQPSSARLADPARWCASQ